jgi:glycosyltransferase involved in cell wall biosynthesis
MSKISIIVPVYNTEQYLSKCIESILNQTESDFELLLIDDGAKDNSGKICDDYALKDNRIRVFHKENGGVSSARNLGLDVAVGEMIFFIDSDDFIGPDYVKTLMIKDGEDFVQSGVKTLENDYLKEIMTHDDIFSDFNRFWMESRQQWPTMCCLSKKVIDEYNLRFDTSLKMGEDGLFNQIFISKCKKIRRICFDQYFYNSDNLQSASHKFYPDRLNQQVLLVKRLEPYFKGDDLGRLRWDYWHEVLNHYQVKGITNSDPEIRKLSKKKIKETYKCSVFKECIPYIRRTGSLDERLEACLMSYRMHMLYKPLLKLIQLLSNVKSSIRK